MSDPRCIELLNLLNEQSKSQQYCHHEHSSIDRDNKQINITNVSVLITRVDKWTTVTCRNTTIEPSQGTNLVYIACTTSLCI